MTPLLPEVPASRKEEYERLLAEMERAIAQLSNPPEPKKHDHKPTAQG
jgi:hypothetical protein